MRWSSLLTEAWRNVASGTALAGWLAALLGGLVVLAVGLGCADVLSLTEQSERFRAAGAAILILRAPDAVDGSACEALNETPGVRAGALRASSTNIIGAALPNSSVPTYDVTSGLPALLGAGDAGQGVLVSAQVADTLASTPSGGVATASGNIAVGAVFDYPDDGRRADLAFAILVPTTSTAQFDECWAETWPQSPGLESLLRTTFAPKGSGNDLTVLQLNGTLGEVFEGEELYELRGTRWLPSLAAVVAFLVAFAAARLRRVELASARHAGVTLADQLVIVSLESAAWVALVIGLVTPVTCAFVLRAASGDAAAYLQVSVATTALAVLAGVGGSTVAVMLSGERHLFRLFKGRR